MCFTMFTQTRSLAENIKHIKNVFYTTTDIKKRCNILYSPVYPFIFLCPQFNPASPLSHADPDFINDPNPNDKVHCLVSVVPADSITLMPNEVIQKMKNVRKEALSLGEWLKDAIYNNVAWITLLYWLFYICWFACNI